MNSADVNDSAAAAPSPLADDPLALASALGGGDPMGMLMSQLSASNPQAAMMLRMMEERNRAREAERQQEEQEQAAEAAAQREHDFEELKQTVERACAELDALRARQDALADALGACSLCFGSDALCEQCHGRGRPGGRAPDPAAFRTYVLPALRRARAIEARRQAPSPAPPSRHRMQPSMQTSTQISTQTRPQHSSPTPAPARQSGFQP